MQSDIFFILIKFRKHKFVVRADAEKMYRQILIEPKQRSLQKIVWRDNRDQNLKYFKLNTVTYGTASASYLATRTLIELTNQNETKYADAAKILKEDMYVDDLITGNDNLETLVMHCQQINDILKSALFNLRKWKSNTKQFQIQTNLCNETSNHNLDFSGNETKTLGIIFNNQTDEFRFSFKEIPNTQQQTKRTILSQTAQVYDPLGLLSPITIIPKLIIQELWKCKLNYKTI